MDVNGFICMALMNEIDANGARRARAFGALDRTEAQFQPVVATGAMCSAEAARRLRRVVAARLGLEEDGQDLGRLRVARRCGPACHAADPQAEQ